MPETLPVALLVHLSGAERGRSLRITGATRMMARRGGRLRYVPGPSEGEPDEGQAATFVPDEDGWRLHVDGDQELWVNGTKSDHHVLHDGDLIEVGRSGTLLRFRPRRGATDAYKTVREAFEDCVDCARMGGQNSIDRTAVIVLGTPYELLTQVAPTVRVAAIAAVLAVVATVTLLWARNDQLRDELSASRILIEEFSAMIDGYERDSFSAQDFAAAQSALDTRLSSTLDRLAALEDRATARGRVIGQAADAVVFLQGAYGFVETRTGQVLRIDTRVARALPPGVNPPLTLEGDGPPLELRFTGTGFVLEGGGLVVTNRHVAQPWDFDENAQRTVARGFTPVMRRMIGYLPHEAAAFDVSTAAASELADVAILRSAVAVDVRGLRLADRVPEIGDEVVVLGYPTGMRALMARADPAFVEQLMRGGPLGFWELAEALAASDFIAPLATVGSVGQTSVASVVYDAETTHGGSGGPVLDLDGAVVAVNTAILPEFGGSNLGVPIARVRELLTTTQPTAARPESASTRTAR